MKCQCGKEDMKNESDWMIRFVYSGEATEIHSPQNCGVPAKENCEDPFDPQEIPKNKIRPGVRQGDF